MQQSRVDEVQPRTALHQNFVWYESSVQNPSSPAILSQVSTCISENAYYFHAPTQRSSDETHIQLLEEGLLQWAPDVAPSTDALIDII